MHKPVNSDYELSTAFFLIRDEGGNYSFAHKSFLEFFLARKIKKEFIKENFDILNLKLLSKEIVFFFRNLIEDDDLIIRMATRLLKRKHRKNISENVLFIFYNVLKMVFLKHRFSLK
ncbi:MAG: hypothetical protein JSV88_25785 [Candidatus Aminicenantes bacterium]|nr:MAG: hypothetical protein JSV88_25785 [Candidatus Aminicenantes bacterium]